MTTLTFAILTVIVATVIAVVAYNLIEELVERIDAFA